MDRESAERTIRRIATSHPDWLLHALEQLSPSQRQSLSLDVSAESTEDEEPESVSKWGRISVACMEFIEGKRKNRWVHRKPDSHDAFLYVDDQTLVEVIEDPLHLRRGDHCLTVLNAVRTLSPTVDYLHSLLGKLRLGTVFHHFVVLDDVASVDECGVPRTSSGRPAGILEYSNTIQGFLDEAEEVGIFTNLFKKANCQRVPLAEYGDMPHLLRVVEKNPLTDGRRDDIVRKALSLINFPPNYHVFWANCEHTTNLICNSEASEMWHSPQVSYLFENLVRYIVHGVGLIVLGVCRNLALFHAFTSLPVALQAMRSHLKTRKSLRSHKKLKSQLKRTIESENFFRHIVVTIKTLILFQLIGDFIIASRLLSNPLLFHLVAVAVCKVYYLVDGLFSLMLLLSRLLAQFLAYKLRFSFQFCVSMIIACHVKSFRSIRVTK